MIARSILAENAEQGEILAQSYLGGVASNSSGPQALGLQALTISGNQDFLVQSVVPAAPEPGTWLMMIFGFGLVGNAMRKRLASGANAQLARS